MEIEILLVNPIDQPSRRKHTVHSSNAQADNRLSLHALSHRWVKYHLSDWFHDETHIQQRQGEHDETTWDFMGKRAPSEDGELDYPVVDG